jgi:Fe-S-cluster containining protein
MGKENRSMTEGSNNSLPDHERNHTLRSANFAAVRPNDGVAGGGQVAPCCSREELLSYFGKYCQGCSAPCCHGSGGGGEVTFFEWELERLPVQKDAPTIVTDWGEQAGNNEKRVERIGKDEDCIFLGTTGCRIAIDQRPLDCITYPITPVIDYGSCEEKIIREMAVHRSCLFADEMAHDKELLGMMVAFWKCELDTIKKVDIEDWFGDMNDPYWASENSIRIICW